MGPRFTDNIAAKVREVGVKHVTPGPADDIFAISFPRNQYTHQPFLSSLHLRRRKSRGRWAWSRAHGGTFSARVTAPRHRKLDISRTFCTRGVAPDECKKPKSKEATLRREGKSTGPVEAPQPVLPIILGASCKLMDRDITPPEGDQNPARSPRISTLGLDGLRTALTARSPVRKGR